jgi:hypothetical protein
MTLRTFRRLLIVSVILSFIGPLVSIATEDRLPSPLREYAAAASAAMPSPVALVGGLILVGAWIAGVVGLYRLKPFGRQLFLFSLMVGVGVTPAYGPYIDLGWGQMFYQLSLVLEGALLALVYWSPLAEHFSPGRRDSRISGT